MRASASAAPPAKDSYLNIPQIVSACEITGADAVHPGYGFLAENARFAEILEEHEITFIGPSAEHVRLMGDKIQAKVTAKTLGLPLVPGSDGPITSLDEAKKVARDIGYPVLVKAAAGGGGRGMKVAHVEEELDAGACHGAHRGQDELRRRHSVSREISRRIRAISKCRCWATARATRSISASATARSSGGIRSFGKRRRRRR